MEPDQITSRFIHHNQTKGILISHCLLLLHWLDLMEGRIQVTLVILTLNTAKHHNNNKKIILFTYTTLSVSSYPQFYHITSLLPPSTDIKGSFNRSLFVAITIASPSPLMTQWSKSIQNTLKQTNTPLQFLQVSNKSSYLRSYPSLHH